MSAPVKRHRSERRRRTVVVAIRLLPEEAEMVRQAAAQRGVSVSDYFRSGALFRAFYEAVST